MFENVENVTSKL